MQKREWDSKYMKCFPNIFNSNPLPPRNSAFAKNRITAQATSLGNVGLDLNVSPNLDVAPEPLFKRNISVDPFIPEKLIHLDPAVKVVGPLECLLQGAQPRVPRSPDFTPLPKLHFKAMSTVLEGDQSSLNSTVIRIFSLCFSLAGECQQHIS